MYVDDEALHWVEPDQTPAELTTLPDMRDALIKPRKGNKL